MVLILPIVAVAVGTALALADRGLHETFLRNTERINAAAMTPSDQVVTEHDLIDLPEPIARYLRFSGVVGRKRISALRMAHSGTFKPGKGRPWMPIHGEYSITTNPPSFAWYGKIRIAPGVSVTAIDSYSTGHGHMLVKAMSLLPIVDDRSDEVSQSAFGRCVAELMMAPTFLLDRDRVRFTQNGNGHVRATITDGACATDADFFISKDGSLDRIVVARAFDRGHGRTSQERFTGRSSQPKNYAGLVLGSKMDGFWNLAEGDLHCASFDIEDLAFD